MWASPIFGKGHGLLLFRAPDLAYLKEPEEAIGFLSVLVPWKKMPIYHLFLHFYTGPSQESQVAEGLSSFKPLSPLSCGLSGEGLTAKHQFKHCIPLLRASVSLSSILSLGKVIPHVQSSKTKARGTMPVLTPVTVVTGVADPIFSGLGRNRPGK